MAFRIVLFYSVKFGWNQIKPPEENEHYFITFVIGFNYNVCHVLTKKINRFFWNFDRAIVVDWYFMVALCHNLMLRWFVLISVHWNATMHILAMDRKWKWRYVDWDQNLLHTYVICNTPQFRSTLCKLTNHSKNHNIIVIRRHGTKQPCRKGVAQKQHPAVIRMEHNAYTRYHSCDTTLLLFRVSFGHFIWKASVRIQRTSNARAFYLPEHI